MMTTPRTAVTPTDTQTAYEYFATRLSLETDCADVHEAMTSRPGSLVLLDVRSAEAYASGHVPGAVSLPHAQISAQALEDLGDAPLVTYCWGPHCNGATKGAAAIAALGRPVKEMLGGVWGWEQEGYELVSGEVAA